MTWMDTSWWQWIKTEALCDAVYPETRANRTSKSSKLEWFQMFAGILGKSHFLLDRPPFRANFGVPLRGSADIPPIDH
jgi:hypothetical protein